MEHSLRCIIVEDEPLAAEILSEYVGQIPYLQLTHVCNDAITALDVVRKHPVEVIFLDINLPKLNGLDFLKTLIHQPSVIITSAHHEFAVEGFDLQVTDYLLKPIEFSRFVQATQKLLQPPRRSESGPIGKQEPVQERPYYFFTVNKRSVKIFLNEILYIESLKDCVAIVTTSKTYPTHYQMGELEDLLRSDNFLRIHRSFLVAVDKIISFSAIEIQLQDRKLPIGRSHKEFVMSQLRRK
jgi:DNA-binding LytR/AlgR family response regulator